MAEYLSLKIVGNITFFVWNYGSNVVNVKTYILNVGLTWWWFLLSFRFANLGQTLHKCGLWYKSIFFSINGAVLKIMCSVERYFKKYSEINLSVLKLLFPLIPPKCEYLVNDVPNVPKSPANTSRPPHTAGKALNYPNKPAPYCVLSKRTFLKGCQWWHCKVQRSLMKYPDRRSSNPKIWRRNSWWESMSEKLRFRCLPPYVRPVRVKTPSQKSSLPPTFWSGWKSKVNSLCSQSQVIPPINWGWQTYLVRNCMKLKYS